MHHFRKLPFIDFPLQAIVALGKMPSEITTAALLRVLNEERYFYRLRMESAKSLAMGSNDPADGAGMVKVIKYYEDKYCFPRAQGSNILIPRPHNFKLIQEYFVKTVRKFIFR